MARVEQQAPHGVISSEQQLMESEVVFSKTLTLRELLQTEDQQGEAKGLFGDVPFYFEVRDAGKSFLYTVSFFDNMPVSFNQLLLLLRAAKPGGASRAGQSSYAISDDWRIILPKVREQNSDAKRLYDFHKRFPEFSDFEANHFELFWKVLESGHRRKEDTLFFNKQLDQFIDEREFFAKYGRQQDFSKNPYIESFAFKYIRHFNQFLGEKGFNMLSNPDPESLDIFRQVSNLFRAMNEDKVRALVIEFYEKSIDKEGIEAERRFGNYFRVTHDGHAKTTLIGAGGELNRIKPDGTLMPLGEVIRYPFMEEADDFKRFDNGQIELKKGESFVRIDFIKGEDGYKKVRLLDSSFSREEEMFPLIVWRKDKQTGERHYDCGKLDKFPRYDTLLGQLIVSAYSPQVRDQMPNTIKFKNEQGEDKEQPMLEASSVLLVPMFDQKFLAESPVILKAEALSGT